MNYTKATQARRLAEYYERKQQYEAMPTYTLPLPERKPATFPEVWQAFKEQVKQAYSQK